MKNQTTLEQFKKNIWKFYEENGRSFQWRHESDPYKIVVSEVMLQQTQTNRVAIKFPEFIKQFPNFQSLADASLHDVLLQWQGLGYNRRGKYLHQIAKKIVDEFQGKVPEDPSILSEFPGIGISTASSICAFAFNKPTVFIETNIRTVFIHFFFKNQINVTDKEIINLVKDTVDKEKPRDWYYALMDYGVMLKKTVPNPSRKSAHYNKQSKFEGSDRQIRGMILKLLTQFNYLSLEQFINYIEREPERIIKALQQLINENFIETKNNLFFIKQ